VTRPDEGFYFFIIHFNAVWEAEEVAYIEIIRALFFSTFE
jgi:hypothetical protein